MPLSIQHSTAQHSTAQHSTAQHSTATVVRRQQQDKQQRFATRLTEICDKTNRELQLWQ